MHPASQPDLMAKPNWATQPADTFGNNALPPQSMLSSTQPVSGVFGSRSTTGAAVKKKKRVGGF